jgi:hypothetical protein
LAPGFTGELQNPFGRSEIEIGGRVKNLSTHPPLNLPLAQ